MRDDPHAPTRWVRALSVLCAAALCSAAFSAPAAEPSWLFEADPAAAQALKQGKLLLVVHLSADFTANAEDSGEAKLYRTAALADAQVAQRLAERFVVVVQAVGPPKRLRPAAIRTKGSPTPGSQAITYVCLPDRRVLHFVPGFVSAGQLLAELTWVETAYAKMLAAAAEEQPRVLRDCHLGELAAADRTLFASQFASRWEDGRLRHGPSTVDLAPAIVAARQTFATSLAGRVANPRDRRALAALSAHGSLGVEFSHLVLGEFPLVDLSDLARPVFEAAAQRRYWTASSRRKLLSDWWNQSRHDGRSALLIVADDPFAARQSQEQFVWPPAGAAEMPELAGLAIEVVSIEELAQLIADADLEAITYKPNEEPPRYLLYDGDTRPAARILRQAAVTRLGQAIAALKRGALAAKVAAEKGADDEEE